MRTRFTFGSVVLLLAAGLVAPLPASAGGGPATKLQIVSTVPNVKSAESFSVTVEAQDGTNSRDFGFTGAITLNAGATGGANFTSPPTANAVQGTVTFNGLSLLNAANGYTITASSSGLTPDPSNSFIVTADHLTLSTVSNVRAGNTFNASVQAKDANNNGAENFTGAITLSAAATGGSNFNGGSPSLNPPAGTITFPNLVLNNAASGYTLTATSPGLTNGVSNSFSVTAHHLTVTTTITDQEAGDSFSATVQGHDGDNNLAENFTGSISLTAAATGGSNFSGGSPSVSAVAGTATFNSLVLNNAADGYAVTASSIGPDNGVSNSFSVTANHLVVESVVSNVRSGDAFNVNVQALDADNVLAENFDGNVSMDAAATGGSNFSGGTQTVAASAGTASFTGVILNNAADGYELTASGAGLTDGASNSFNATAHHLTVNTAISDKVSGSSFNVSVEARDANNNAAENFNDLTSLTAAAPAGSSNFVGGSPSVSASSGTATFTGLTINNAADGYQVTASAVGPNNGVGNSFNVTATHLEVLNLADVDAGENFDVTVEALDIDNNLAENFVGEITLTAAAVGGSNFVGGSPHKSATAGVADFNDLSLNEAAANYTVSAAGGSLVGAVSNEFDVAIAMVNRTLKFNLKKRLKAKGTLDAPGAARCEKDMAVQIQRKRAPGNWAKIKTATTNKNGAFNVAIPDRDGKYRAKTLEVDLESPTTICHADLSPVKDHNH